MRRLTLYASIALFLVIVAAAFADRVLPRTDELYGVTMPDVRFALNREADAREETADGLLLTYQRFTRQDYEALDAYLSSADLTITNRSIEDGVMTVAFERDGSSLTFVYRYAERTATLLYGEDTRLEREAHATGRAGFMPDISRAFGIAIPNLSEQLPLHPAARTVKEDRLDVIRYTEVSRSDYAVINRHLSDLGYDFNFSKLHLMVKTAFSFEEQAEEVIWHVRQENIHAVMETEVHCLKKDMLLINYEAPDGSRHHNRLWNGGSGWGTVKLYDKIDGQLMLVDEVEATHIGCEYGEYDHEDAY